MFPVGYREECGAGRTTRLVTKLSKEWYFYHVHSFFIGYLSVFIDEMYKKELVRRLCIWAVEEGSNPSLLRTIFSSRSEAAEMMTYIVGSTIYYSEIDDVTEY